MSVQSLTWAMGMAVGPLLGGVFLDAGRPWALWAVLMGILALSTLGLRVLSQRLPKEVDQPHLGVNA